MKMTTNSVEANNNVPLGKSTKPTGEIAEETIEKSEKLGKITKKRISFQNKMKVDLKVINEEV